MVNTTSFLRHFRVQVITRLVVLGLTIVLGSYLLIDAWQSLLAFFFLSLIFIQGLALVRHLERGTRDLLSFLEAIEYSDFTQTFSSPYEDNQFKSLYGAFSNVMHAFQDSRAKNEAQRRYLETLVHHIGIGLLCYNPDGAVQLINNAAKKLLDRPALNHIQDLSSLSPALANSLLQVKTGEHDLISVDADGEWLQLAVYATRFILQNETYILVSLQNIGAELEEKELEAMQHMTRVLAHEIMNSITPIASLAASARDHLQTEVKVQAGEETSETFLDLRDALDTIEKRSQGLLHFVGSYRKIARIPRPDFQLIEVNALLHRVMALFEAEAQDKGVKLMIKVEPASLSLLADPDLIEQVLINLLKNAIEAIEDKSEGNVVLAGILDRRSKVLLKVTDNGPGIPDEILNQIFVPFFSTKSTGSGIGLSLSRQIMHRHGGSLRAQSQLGGPTSFTLRF